MEELDKLAGIIGYAVIKAEDGSIEEVKGASSVPVGDLAAFFSSAAEVIRDSLSMGDINYLSLCYGSYRLVVFPHGSKYLGIEVERETETKDIIERISAALAGEERPVEEAVEEKPVEEEKPEEEIEEKPEEEVKEVPEEEIPEAVEEKAEEVEEKVEERVEEKIEEKPVEERKIELPRSIRSKVKQINLLVDEFGGAEQKDHWFELLNQGLGILGGDIVPYIGVVGNELIFKDQPPEDKEDDFVQALRSIIDFLVKKAVEEMGSSQARAKVQAVIERMR